MKVRNGFVSNSSTCSFTIYGTLISDEDISNDEDIDSIIPKGSKLYTHYLPDYYDERGVIGREWRTIGDNETGKEFKESIEKELEVIFGKKMNCSTISEAWYDG